MHVLSMMMAENLHRDLFLFTETFLMRLVSQGCAKGRLLAFIADLLPLITVL